MLTWLSSFALNPVFLILGGLAILSPIIIHLLNRRRFRIVDWAAMEFLLDANRKNRRRVRIENLLLLLLRCIAMFLIGALLSRPFFSSGIASTLFEGQPVERIVLLDDSMSMSLQEGNLTIFDKAKQDLVSTVQGLANDNAGDLLTVFVTSRPDSPVFSNRSINSEDQNSIVDDINQLDCSDKPANMQTALQQVSEFIAQQKAKADRMLYVMTDMRERDWKDSSTTENENSPRNLVKTLSDQVTACYMVNAGINESSNLVITSIKPLETLRSGVSSRFDVVVSNVGSETANNVRVRFQIGEEGIPKEELIQQISPGTSSIASFTFRELVPLQEEIDTMEPGDRPVISGGMMSLKVRATILPSEPEKDRLLADSEAYFAARVIRGYPILVVDGDPSSNPVKGETYYLQPAISPPGEWGNLLTAVTYTEFETLSLSEYRVIFLCNVDEISTDRLSNLKTWVENGGGLVIMPGDRVVAETFNKQFFQKGKGLSPIELVEIQGDVTRTRWEKLSIPEQVHPIARVFEGSDNPLLEMVKVFSWWQSNIDKENFGKTVETIALLTDEFNSPAIAEKTVGDGKVITFAFSADRDWNDWAVTPSYLIAMQELIRHLCDSLAGASELQIGETVSVPLDLTVYQRDASIKDSTDEKFSIQATSSTDDETSAETIWNLNFEDTDRRGFYDLSLTRKERKVNEGLLFAANVDPSEGQLAPLDLGSLEKDFFGEKTKILTGVQMSGQSIKANQNEIWKYVLYLLFGVLAIELFLGWYFGSKRG